MIRIEVSDVFHVPVQQAFEFITDVKNWPRYWPDSVRIDDADRADWGTPGDRIAVVQRLLGRAVTLHMELLEFRPNEYVRYRSRQSGLPDVDHERHFNAVHAGTHYRLVVMFTPRNGLRGFFDRLFVKRGIERALRVALENLQRALAGQEIR